ncbi:MAG: response regulator [Verrucomicrobiae bacterium]|nr:response regulator [Verrucomicrobiae bacterium]
MKRILLIEDEADHAELIGRALQGAPSDYEILHARNLAAAREMLVLAVPDLALVDYRLPDGRGDEFVVSAAGRFPVILLTAFGNERTAVEAIKAGALDYVVKSPEMFADMTHLVQRSLREWENINERKHAEARLEGINRLLSTMGPDFTENAQRLTELLARETDARMVFFASSRGRKLVTISGWRIAESLPACGACQCAACRKILDYAAGHYQEVAQAKLDPDLSRLNITPGEHHTFVGKIVSRQQEPVGVICLFFDRPYQPSEADRRLMSILASALGAEENRKRTDDELRAMDGRYRQIIQTANEGIWVTDEMDHLTFVNRRLADLLGYEEEELLRQPVRNFIEPADVTDHDFKVQLGRRGQFCQFERRLRRKDGSELLAWVSGSPLFDDIGHYRGSFAMLTDLTERRQLESQLRQAQKLDSVGQLAGGVAHDFNNILAAIMMHLSLLHQNPNLDEETTEALKELESEAKRAANLTRQLLMFSRRSVMQMRVMDVNEVVRNLFKMLRRLLGEHIAIRFDEDKTLPSVEGDTGMLEQVLLNLAVNARDAMPKGGNLVIATCLQEIDAEGAKHNSDRRVGSFVRLTVADNGVGMDDAIIKRIFEPFFTTKEIGKGTGLGLPTAYGIIKQHSGWVEVESRPGEGSTFHVFLPAKLDGRRADELHTTPLPLLRGHGTLLLVEDEDIVRRPIGIYLRKLGYHVLEAANGNQALALWQQHRDQIDLLYTDMVMPEGVTGLELAEKLRAEKSSLQIIISSGYSTEFSAHGVTTDAGFIYLPKPSSSNVIASTVRTCMEQKNPVKS